jgi:hypothetical protein
MPHWTCERCGARLYSASESLRRAACPVCNEPLASPADPPPRFGRQGRAGDGGSKNPTGGRTTRRTSFL